MAPRSKSGAPSNTVNDPPRATARIPVELVHHITSYLRNYPRAVFNCIHVSRLWYTAALPHLYYKYTVKPGANLPGLEELLQRDPRVQYWIEIVHITTLFPHNHLAFLFDFFLKVASKLSRIRIIEFDKLFILGYNDWQGISFEPFLQVSSAMSTVHTIEFLDCIITKRTLSALIGAFPSISTVIWRGPEAPLEPTLPETSEFYNPRHSPRVDSMHIFLQNGWGRHNLFAAILPHSTRGMQTLHLDLFMPKMMEQWITLREVFTSLGHTLQHLTLRLPVSEPVNNNGWLTSQMTSHIDLSVLPNLVMLHFSSLHYKEASLHLLRGLISRKIRKITLDATFDFVGRFKPQDFSEHDDILVSPIRSELEEVLVRYFGAVTPKKVQSRVASVFPKTNRRNLLRVEKISSYSANNVWDRDYLPRYLDY